MATLALAQDNAFGQPLESQLRSCLLARWICEAAGLDEALCETVCRVALRRYIGCTGHAHEVSSLFGDAIAIRARTLVHDAASPADVMQDVVAFATAGKGDHHIQHTYTKIGVSTRAAAMLWAIQHAVVP